MVQIILEIIENFFYFAQTTSNQGEVNPFINRLLKLGGVKYFEDLLHHPNDKFC